jgi:sugar phosphate isomerase/epimerase
MYTRKETVMNISKIAMAAVAAASVGCSSVKEPSSPAGCGAARPASPSCRVQDRLPYKLGVARYTMHARPFDRTLEIMQDIDCHYLGLIESTIPRDATDAEIAAYKAKCAKYGVEVVSLGPLYYSTEAELAAACKFAKRYGMKYISVVPFEWNPKIANVADPEERKKICPPREWRLESDKMMDLLEKYCREYDLRAAVHNHGPDNAYLYPTAESALKRIGKRDNKRLGVCLDVGHERRAGLDPVEFIKKNGDRVVEVHLKNIKVDPVANYAKEGPRGELDIPGILKALADVGFGGYCLVEYEKDFEVNEVPLAESFGYYRGVMDCVFPKKR